MPVKMNSAVADAANSFFGETARLYLKELPMVAGRQFTGMSSRRAWIYYLIMTHTYYNRDTILLPDSCYDELCKRLLEIGVKGLDRDNAWHLELADEGQFAAGTGYAIAAKIPETIVRIADVMLLLCRYPPLTPVYPRKRARAA